MKYYSTMKRNEVLRDATAWMGLKNIILKNSFTETTLHDSTYVK